MAEQPTPLEEEPPPSEEVKKSEDTLIIVETERPNRCHMCLVCAKLYWRTFVVILVPLIFLPLLFINKDLEKEFMCLYCVIIMGIYWITEAVPTPITSLLPVFLFPFFGILETENVCMLYLKETTLMFIGSLIVATAIEYSGLHVRFALKCLLIVGCSHRRLTLGLFVCTMFISMWITNAAATAMMTPIITAIIETLEKEGMCVLFKQVADPNDPGSTTKPSRTTLGYFLGVAYAATIGGVSTYVGTGTNLAARDYLESKYPEGVPHFHEWMIITIPCMLLNIVGLWLWINFLYLGLFWKGGCDPQVRAVVEAGKEEQKRVEQVVKDVILTQYKDLGRMKWHEIITGIVFLFCVCLWFFRSPNFVPGWADVLLNTFYINETKALIRSNKNLTNITAEKMKDYIIKDAGTTTFVIFLFFAIPATMNCLRFFKTKAANELPNEEGSGLMTWDLIQNKVAWGLLFVIGSGFTIAEASNKSGMSTMIGNTLTHLGKLPEYWIMFVSCLMASILTEFTSNVPVVNILSPPILTMSKNLNLNGPFLYVPLTISCSNAFMMPVGTPPNAIVAGLVHISSKDMIIGGLGIKVIAQLTTSLTVPFITAAIKG